MSGLLSWSEEHCESICCLRTWLLPKLKCKDFSAAHIIFFLTLYNKVCVDICVHIFILMLAGNSFFVCNSFIPFFFAMFTFKPKVCPKNTDMLPRLWRKVITWAWFFFFFCLYCFHFLHLRVLHFFMLCSNRNTLDSVNVQIAFPSLLLSPPILDKKWFPLWLLRAPLCSYAPCWELQDRGVLCPRFWRWLTPVSLVRPWCLTTHISRRRDLSTTLDSESSVFVLTAPMRFQSFFIAPVSYSGCTCSVDKVPCPRHVAFTGLL